MIGKRSFAAGSWSRIRISTADQVRKVLSEIQSPRRALILRQFVPDCGRGWCSLRLACKTRTS